MTRSLTLIVPGNPEQRTGGYLYDRRITEELRQLGWTVSVIGLEGRFPIADAIAKAAMEQALARLSDASQVLIDGLALGGTPDALAPHAGRLTVTALVHHPLGDETGLTASDRRHLLDAERRALALCRRIIVTSPFTARRLVELGLSDRPAQVIEPGVEAAALAPAAKARWEQGAEPEEERMLCVASLTPRKGQNLLLDALAGLASDGWRCRLSGSDQRDPEFAAGLRAQRRRLKLADRVELVGERDENQLAADYDWATLCVLPSHYEGYGMVVSEALARGLPMISTTGGALADTLPDGAGIKVAPGRPEQLRAALQRWLEDPALRRALTRGAIQHRAGLSSWTDSARRFAEALDQPPAEPAGISR